MVGLERSVGKLREKSYGELQEYFMHLITMIESDQCSEQVSKVNDQWSAQKILSDQGGYSDHNNRK